jgi:SNF2 family DNA or RNA helicase
MSYYQMIDRMNKLPGVQLSGKEYQRKGVEWCINQEKQKSDEFIGGGLIADEMGLGKTLTILMVILLHYQPRTLLVVPPSILHQWYDEIYRLTGHQALIYHGAGKKKITREQLDNSPIVLTTYHTITATKTEYMDDSPNKLIHNVRWGRIIYDEAHNMKNRNRFHYGAMSMTTKLCWFISGTPIQNRYSDYRNLCRIMGYSSKNATIPILRRTLADLKIRHNGITNHIHRVKWSDQSLELAKPHHQQMLQPDDEVVISKMQKCRQICAMPSLYGNKMNGDNTVYTNDKMISISEHVYQHRNSGKGKLIFCNYTEEMRAYKSHLTNMGINVVIINGETTMRKKHHLLSRRYSIKDDMLADDNGRPNYLGFLSQDIVRYINAYVNIDVYLIQIQSSCDGLNLQHLSEVYFTAPAWNPSVEQQAVARCYRTGQTEHVNVYRFQMESFTDDGFENVKNMDEYVCATQLSKNLTTTTFYNDVAPLL